MANVGSANTAAVADISDSAGSTFTLTVNWGDGTAADHNARIESDGHGGYNVVDTHTYSSAALFHVTVTVQDNHSNTVTVPSIAIANTVINTYPLGTTPNEIFVERMYRLLLSRNASYTSGAGYWVNQLNGGTAAYTVVDNLEQSGEYVNDLVEGLYVHYLRRNTDSGAQYWVGLLENGTTIENVTSQILGTTEYYNDKGATNTGFIQGMYQDMLGRSPSANELQTYLNALNGGASRTQVALDALTSTEYRDDLLGGGAWSYGPNWGGYFPEFLHRQPSGTELTDWVQNFNSGMTEQVALGGLLGQTEGFGKQSDASLTGTVATVNATEGSSFHGTVATFTDGDPSGTANEFAATVDWGDGTAPDNSATIASNGHGFTVTGTHTYAEDGTYSIAVTIRDSSGSFVQVASTAHVADATLTPTGGFTVNAVEGANSGLQTVATFRDANPGNHTADMTATLNWGGSGTGSTSGTITYNSSSGVYTVQGSFAYAEEGSYTVGVTINDVGGKTASATSTAAVADAPLTAGALTPPAATEEQAFSNVTVFHFTDADPNGTVGDYTAVVTLGDGNQVTLTSAASGNGQIVAHTGGGFDVQLSYTYAEELSNASFAVQVYDTGDGRTINNPSDSTTSASTGAFNVADALLRVGSFTPPANAVEGQSFTNLTVLHFTDDDPNGSVGDYTAVVTLGDGHQVTLTSTPSGNGQIVTNTGGGFDVQLSYTYAEELTNATFAVQVYDTGDGRTVSNPSDSSAGYSTNSFSVADAPLTLVSFVPPSQIVEGQPLSLTVMHFTDADPNASADDYTAVISPGDGSQVTLTSTLTSNGQIVLDGNGFDVNFSYTYTQVIANAATFAVTVYDTGDGRTVGDPSDQPVNASSNQLTTADAAAPCRLGCAPVESRRGAVRQRPDRLAFHRRRSG